MERQELLDQLWTFTDERCYILVAIARSKENDGVRATDQPTMRKVVESRDEIQDKIDQLAHAADRFENTYRLYGTVNGRNSMTALSTLQHEIVSAKEQSRKSGETPHIAKRIDHEWKSILHQPGSRDQKRFLWDVDEPDENARDIMQELLEGEIILTQETPNGWHIVTEPFNFTEINFPSNMEYERKTDDMVFLGFL